VVALDTCFRLFYNISSLILDWQAEVKAIIDTTNLPPNNQFVNVSARGIGETKLTVSSK